MVGGGDTTYDVSVECTTSYDRKKANRVPNGKLADLSCLHNFPCREGMKLCEFV